MSESRYRGDTNAAAQHFPSSSMARNPANPLHRFRHHPSDESRSSPSPSIPSKPHDASLPSLGLVASSALSASGSTDRTQSCPARMTINVDEIYASILWMNAVGHEHRQPPTNDSSSFPKKFEKEKEKEKAIRVTS